MTWGGGKPHHVGDRGQRYEVSYDDGHGTRRTFGWSDDKEGANRMTAAIDLNPVWHSPQILDRGPSLPTNAAAGPIHTIKFNVTPFIVDKDNFGIRTEIDGAIKESYTKLFSLQDEAIRAALIELGWTPPEVKS